MQISRERSPKGTFPIHKQREFHNQCFQICSGPENYQDMWAIFYGVGSGLSSLGMVWTRLIVP